MIPLRPYQLEGIERVREVLRSGKRRIVFVLATGGGKTVVAAHLVQSSVERGKRCLFLAPRRELVRQTFAKLVRMGLAPDQVGIIMAGVSSKVIDSVAPDPQTLDDQRLWEVYARRRPQAPVQVASIDTLRGRQLPPADLVIPDECHRSVSPSCRAILESYDRATIVGLTATPYRADGRGLGELYEEIVVIASPQLLVDEGFLVEPKAWGVPKQSLPDLAGVKTRGGDYDAEQLAEACDKTELIGDIVDHWTRLGRGLRTVVFAASVAHSKRIAARFCEAGIAAEHLDGTTQAAERDAILDRLRRGETRIVSNCGVLCEGWDMPSVKCLILARPTKSTGLYLQMAGRILRPYEGLPAIILDHAANVTEHGYPTLDRTFSLEPRKKKLSAGAAPAKTCPGCFAILPAALRICDCGYEFPAAERSELEEAAGQLVELKAPPRPPNLAAVAKWDAIVEEWRAQNEQREVPLEPKWCVRRWREMYHTWPPRGSKWPALTPEQRELIVKAEEARKAPLFGPKLSVELAEDLLKRHLHNSPMGVSLVATNVDRMKVAREVAIERASSPQPPTVIAVEQADISRVRGVLSVPRASGTQLDDFGLPFDLVEVSW